MVTLVIKFKKALLLKRSYQIDIFFFNSDLLSYKMLLEKVYFWLLYANSESWKLILKTTDILYDD